MATDKSLDMGMVTTNYKILGGLVMADLQKEYDSKRIKGTEYADVYNKLMSAILQLAMQSPLENSQINDIDAKTLGTIASTKIAVEQSNADLQIKGKEVDLKQAQIDLTKCDLDKCEAGTELIIAQKEDQEYVTQYIRPSEKSKMEHEASLMGYRADDQQYVTQFIRPEEKDKLAADASYTNARRDDQVYVTNYIRPEELSIKQAEVDIAQKKLLLTEKEIDLKQQQIDLTERQIEGFKDNLQLKMLEIQMNAWAMMFSSGILEETPGIITNDETSKLYNCMKVSAEVPPGGC